MPTSISARRSRRSHIIAWIIGIIFGLAGIEITFGTFSIRGLLLLAASALLIPPSALWIEQNANIIMSRWSRVLVYIVGFVLIGWSSGNHGTPPKANDISVVPDGQAESYSSSSTQSLSTSSAADASSTTAVQHPDTASVLDLIDGDTLRVQLADGTVDKVRVIGIDTPETVDPQKPVQCFGNEAKEHMVSLVQGKNVVLVRNPAEDRDKYQRLLRYIDLDGTDIGAVMIADGFAFSYKQYPHPRLAEYNTLENSARVASKGLWGACPASSSQARSQAATQATQAQPPSAPPPVPAPTPTNTQECVIKGNISSDGERIYHLPGCGSYNKTKIDEGAGERWFCTEGEAQAAGWRRAGNC